MTSSTTALKLRSSSNPYVGPRSFQTGENLYGRSREGAELLDLLIAERIVLLHSPSGAGKSSLVNASLIPQMREQGFWNLPTVRVNLEPPDGFADKAGFNRYVFSALRSLESELPARSQYKPDALAAMSMAQYMKEYPERLAAQNEEFDKESSLFIIFDQFEEVIRISAVDRDAKIEFFNQAGEMLRDRNLWALFAIREDYLAAMEPYNRPIPNRFNVTYRLDFLDARSAIEAIQSPARDKEVTFEDAAASKLVDDLRRIRVQQADGTALEQLGLYVEPVQLQVVCRRLWGAIGARKTITVEDVSRAGNIDDALGDYYAFHTSSVAADAGVSERQVREWFDRKLITVNGIRGQVLMEPDASGGLSNKAIKMMQEAYLVRADKRGNAVWFELAHDRLTRPIRRNNAAWFLENLSVFQRQADLWNNQSRPDSLLLRGKAYLEADEWARGHAEELLPAEQDFLDACKQEYQNAMREQRTNRLIRWAAVLMTVLALAALFFFYQAQQETKRATEQEQRALAEAERANQQTERANQQQALAEQQTALASQKEQIAHLRELAAQSVSNLGIDPELSIRLALQATQNVDLQQAEMRSAIQQVEDALRQALPAMRVEHVLRDTAISGADSLTHNGTVWGSAFSPSGQRLATAGNDGVLKVWDTVTGRLVANLALLTPPADGYGVTSVAFSPDGKLLAAATGEGRIVLYETSGWTEVKSQPVQEGVIWGLAFSPDNTHLVSGGEGGALVVWTLADDVFVQPLNGHTGDIQAVTYSPDGTRLATAGADSLAIVWDANTYRPLYRLQGHSGYVNSVAFSPDGKQLATAGGEDRSIILWNISQPGTPKALTITGHRDWVYSLAYSRDGSTLISVSADRTVRFWDTTYGRPGMVLVGHKDQVYGLAISRDGKRIATSSKDKTVRIWNVSPEGSREWLTFDNRASVYDIAVSADGAQLASAGGDGLVRLWNTTSGRLLNTLGGHQGIVNSVSFRPDGQRIATAGQDGTTRIWDTASAKELFKLGGDGGPLQTVAYSPDGKNVASGGETGTVTIWDAENGDPVFELPSTWGAAFSLDYNPDGSILAVGYYDQVIILWDTKSGSQLAALTGHTDIVQVVAFDPSGKLLASGGDDGSVILWDMDPSRWGQSQAPIRGRGDTLFGLAFSADGKFLYTGGADGIGVLWNLEDRTVELQTYGHTDRIYEAAVSPNGKYLYSAGRDGSVRAYVFGLEELIKLANQRTTREFSEDECRQYLNAACPTDSGVPVETPSSQATTPLKQPSDVPSSPESFAEDDNSSVVASELRAVGGDQYDLNLFERPFNGGEMNIYYPDVDITRALLSQDRQWMYVTISLAGPRGDGLYGNYGVELDLDVDGRGDYFITTLAPGKDWSTNGVRIWNDRNGDVGNAIPYVSDPPQTGDGYEMLVFDQGNGDAPDLAWSRINPNDPNSVQIAFQRGVIANDPVFSWVAWASRDAFKPAWFDYNDRFTFQEAGSPLRELLKYYPLKALAGVDNTCHSPVGFNAPGQTGFCQPEQADGEPSAP